MTIVSHKKEVSFNMPMQTFLNLSEDKKEQIITAAIDELYQNGYQKTSIAKIIEKAGIPRGSFYQYFEDKKDLYKFIIIDVIGSKKHNYASSVLVDIDNTDFIEIIKQLFVSGINFYKDYPKLAAIATDLITLRDAKLKSEILGDSEKLGNEYFINLINNKKAKGEIDSNIDSEMLNYLISSLNMSFVEYFINKVKKNYENDELIKGVDSLTYILKSGILTKNK